MQNRTLEEYIENLRKYDDFEILRNELKIGDNYTVILYGNKDEIFSKVTQAFIDSPSENGIREAWNRNEKLEWNHDMMIFNYEAGTVNLGVIKRIHGKFLGIGHKINGQDHSIYIMFHSYQEKKMENVSWVKAMALAIAEFGDYILRNDITARFPEIEPGINSIPENK